MANILPIRFVAATLIGMAFVAGCKPQTTASTKPPPPAKVDTIAQEWKLNTVVLTAEAEGRLGLKTSAIERRAVERRRTLSGDVTLPAGASIIVAAPFTGTLRAPDEGKLPFEGALVRRAQPMALLVPLLSPLTAEGRLRLEESRQIAAGQVEQAQAQFDAADEELDTQKKLLNESAGTKRAVQQAQAAWDVAKVLLDAALKRQELLNLKPPDAADATVAPLAIEAPQEGVVKAVHATEGEPVTAGAPLFEVLNYAKVWIKVPVYVGDEAEIVRDRPAQVGSLARSPERAQRSAQPVQAPPTATALAATVDLYYELDNPDGAYRPGQRVGVTLVLTGDDESLLVPWSAVVHDSQGGSWVYEKTAPLTFVRRRVEVRFITAIDAVLAQGPAAGAEVVTDGAAELYGTEFGFGK
jgi:RND family efflux transporter MFP subunit